MLTIISIEPLHLLVTQATYNYNQDLFPIQGKKLVPKFVPLNDETNGNASIMIVYDETPLAV